MGKTKFFFPCWEWNCYYSITSFLQFGLLFPGCTIMVHVPGVMNDPDCYFIFIQFTEALAKLYILTLVAKIQAQLLFREIYWSCNTKQLPERDVHLLCSTTHRITRMIQMRFQIGSFHTNTVTEWSLGSKNNVEFWIQKRVNLVSFSDVLLTVHLSIFISVFNQLDAQNLFHNKFYFMPLHASSTCARSM